jgi:hypothetical protein
MTHSVDLRAIGYGIVTFIVGYLLLGIPTTFVANSAGSALAKPIWLLVEIGTAIVPAVAGYVAAYHARSRRIAHGTIGGALGATLFIAGFALFFPGYPAWGAPVLIALFALIASLGAIIGNHRRGKLGP